MSENKILRKTLAQKYEIPIEFLDFEYIKNCDDAKTLERIVLILRSGEEGYYPDLTKSAEEKLQFVKPQSKLLRVEKPVKKTAYLDEDEKKMVEEEISSFMNDMKLKNDFLKEVEGNSEREIPPIRKVNNADKNPPNTKKTDKVKIMDYDKWDKYDADAEALKIELDEERQREIINAKNRKNAPKLIEIIEDKTVESLTEVERDILATKHKDKGNECFKAKDFEEAITEYSQSIRIKPNAAAYNNRALMYLKTKKYQKALNDCEACLKMEPENVKALFRKGQALSEMRNHREACDTFEQVLAIDPSNSTASQEIIRLEQILPPKDTFRMKIEEIGEPILNEPTWKRAQKKTEKLELDENKKIPSMFQNIVPEEKSPFDGFNKKQPPKEKLVMPGNEKIGKKKGILIQEIN